MCFLNCTAAPDVLNTDLRLLSVEMQKGARGLWLALICDATDVKSVSLCKNVLPELAVFETCYAFFLLLGTNAVKQNIFGIFNMSTIDNQHV